MHCDALAELFVSDTLRTVFICPSGANKFCYYVGDASAEGFGGTTQFPDGTVHGRKGVWDKEFAK
jgi:hypothetical protein